MTLSNYNSLTITIVLLIAILTCYFLAGFIANRQANKDQVPEDVSPIESSLLGLLALLLAFTFSMSASRFETRRQLVIQESNDIGTAILRADLYPDSIRQQLRADFRSYVEARIHYYEVGEDREKIDQALQQAEQISSRIWKKAASLAQNKDNLISSNQMIPALNSMIDIVTTRQAAGQGRVPDSILWMLFILCLISSFILGYHQNKKSHSNIIIVVFSIMISACIYLILDLDRPRQGLINNDAVNQHIIELRKMF